MLVLSFRKTLSRHIPKKAVAVSVTILTGVGVYIAALNIAMRRYQAGTSHLGSPHFLVGLATWFSFYLGTDMLGYKSSKGAGHDIPIIASSTLRWGGLVLILCVASGATRDQIGLTGLLVVLSVPGRIASCALSSLLIRCLDLTTPVRLLIVGSGQIAQLVAASIIRYEGKGTVVLGIVDDETHLHDRQERLGLPTYRVADMGSVIEKLSINRVVFAFSSLPDSSLVKVMRACRAHSGVEVDLIPRFFETMSPRTRLLDIHGLSVLHMPPDRGRMDSTLKQIFDRVLAGVGLVILFPLILLAILAIRIEGRGPVFFQQTRVGRNGRLFTMYKLRSMREARAGEGVDDPARYTGVGAILRKWSIDELPQLWNVLRGDMSIVGPRPEREEYVKHFSEQIPGYEQRHRVRGGLTGLAQIKGLRGDTSIVERTRLDNFYIETWSFWFDLRIILMTFTALIARRQGIGGDATFLDLVSEVANSRAIESSNEPIEPVGGVSRNAGTRSRQASSRSAV